MTNWGLMALQRKFQPTNNFTSFDWHNLYQVTDIPSKNINGTIILLGENTKQTWIPKFMSYIEALLSRISSSISYMMFKMV